MPTVCAAQRWQKRSTPNSKSHEGVHVVFMLIPSSGGRWSSRTRSSKSQEETHVSMSSCVVKQVQVCSERTKQLDLQQYHQLRHRLFFIDIVYDVNGSAVRLVGTRHRTGIILVAFLAASR